MAIFAVSTAGDMAGVLACRYGSIMAVHTAARDGAVIEICRYPGRSSVAIFANIITGNMVGWLTSCTGTIMTGKA
jgi:hypothetical protein